MPNFGIRLFLVNKKLVYITDTKTLEGINAKNYDLYFVEGNYDEQEIQERIIQKEKEGLYVNEYRTIDTHLSVQESTRWLLENMGENSTYEFIHQHKDKRKEDKKYD